MGDEELDKQGPPPAPEAPDDERPLLSLGSCLAWGALLAIVLMIAIPNLIEANKHGAEVPPIGALKTISTSQSLFREGDKDGDGTLDYGTLTELGQANLIDALLAGGTKQGYTYAAWPSPSEPKFRWMAIANPIQAGDGNRYFATNHDGVTYYTTTGPFTYRADCKIPAGAQPVGK